MMKPEVYTSFYSKLKEKGIILINSPNEYNHYHLLPNWYPEHVESTAKSVICNNTSIESALSTITEFDAAIIIKDYVKSRKHEWYDACFIPDVHKEQHAEEVITNFVTRQGESLVGGIVLREFLSLKPIGYHEISGMPISEEYRIFILAGKIIVIDNYWIERGQVTLNYCDIQWIHDQIAHLKSNFVTMDIVRTVSGKLVIMEFGDGQVSGLQQLPAESFYTSLSITVESDASNDYS